MRWLLIAIFTVFFFCSNSVLLPAQSTGSYGSVYFPKFKIDKYSLESGLSSPRVRCLLEHSSGFLYVGTEFGLNRFDGYEFKVIDNSYLPKSKLSGTNISRIKEIWDGNILITYGKGSDSFDILNPYSLSLKVVSITPESGFHGVMAGVTTDEDLNTYFLSYDSSGLYLYILQRDFSLKKLAYVPQSMDFKKANLKTLEFFKFRVQRVQNEAVFWVSNKVFGLLKLRVKERGTEVQQVHPPLHIPWKPYLWELDNTGAIRMEEPFTHLIYSGLQPSNIPRKYATDWYSCFGFMDELNNWLLAGSKNRVLQQFEKGDGFRIILNSGRELELPYTFVFDWNTQLLISSKNFEQYFWIGTFDGLRKVTLQQSNVRQLFARQIADGVYGSRMRGIGENAKGNMLFLPETGMAYFRHGANGSFKELPGKWSSGKSVTVDAAGNFWCSGDMAPYGLVCLDPDGQKWTGYAPGTFYSVHTQVRSGRILAARTARELEGKGGGLDIIDPQTGQIQLFTTKTGLNPFEKITPSYLLETRDGILWVATSKGLFKVQLEQGVCQKYTDVADSSAFWANLGINVLLEMPDGKLMLGTTSGLVILDLQKGQFKTYTSNDGLCNNQICGILPGEKGNYWISTYNGLSNFNYPEQSFHNYFERDGLTHNEFNRYSFFKAQDGTFYFGGMNGVNVFSEKDLFPDAEETAMFISEVSFFEKDKLQVYKAWNSDQVITLPAQNRYFAIKVGSFDMTNANENVFAYRIDGLDEEWVMMGKQHEFRFTFLPDGKYTLRIKSAPPNGRWSSKELAIPLVVNGYWYNTWWAYLVYAFSLAGLFWVGLIFQKRRLNMEHENQHLKEVDSFKSRFFTNITHEFRTPLTVIMGVSEQIGEQVHSAELKSKIGLIHRNGHNLLRLINEILDLAKLENKSLKLQYIQGDILAYLRYIAESLHSLSNAQNVMLRVESTQAQIMMDYDPDRILQVAHNLLSNAIKFTSSGGRVVMQVETTGNHLQIKVSDTGVGIPEEDLPRIFERFFQAKNQSGNKSGGTGIGLSLTRELVRAMGGDIQVSSVMGKGTQFLVNLPIRQESAVQIFGQKPADTLVDFIPGVETKASTLENVPIVLIIEDNPDVVEYLGYCLGDAYQKEYAFNGKAGIEKAFELVPDIIISDVMMPEKDGFEVCDMLKNDERTSHIPIVLLTAKADAASRIAGLRRGADVYLSKPFHREELMVQLQNLLELRSKMKAYYTSRTLKGNGQEVAVQVLDFPDMEDQFLQKLRELVNQNLSNPKLSQDFICQQMGMSRTNLYRKLMGLTDLPLTMFIRDLRLQKAQQLLKQTTLNISEIAYECGFDDPKYFSRVFSEVFGVPPSAFRETY